MVVEYLTRVYSFNMPFITIELPRSLAFTVPPFAEMMHQFLSEELAIPIEKLKTKLHLLPSCYVGHGNPEHTYARLKIELMRGRDRKKLIAVGKELLVRFKAAIQEQNPGAHARVTCEFHEIDPELLFA